jgi:hypothetical protein
MTVWVLHQQLTPQDEAAIRERTHLVLPFDGLPDLSRVTRPDQMKYLLRQIYPDDPPESVIHRFDRNWSRYYGLHAEDILAVPLKSRQEIAVAEVSGSYQYDEGVHRIPVKWHAVAPLRKFRKYQNIFHEGREKMTEVTNQDARVAIRDCLPHAYNRFVRWKWLLVVFFLMGVVRLFVRTAQP